jgi:dihydroorotate dehydrogenase (NAD+) catalytic subunit
MTGVNTTADLSVEVGSLTLKNPVLTASGTFGYGLEYDAFFDVAELGGICTKGLSLSPRAGNPPERICETAAGMLNAIGLANVGVEAFCKDKLPILRRRGVTVVANIFAITVDDFVTIARRVDADEGVAAIELNVSCPNVDKGGLEFGCDPVAAARVTAAVKPLALRMVWELARAVRIPVIGIGGIARAEDAIEFLLAGATAIQVGTANFADPMASMKVLEGLAAYCAARGMSARDLIGKMR